MKKLSAVFIALLMTSFAMPATAADDIKKSSTKKHATKKHGVKKVEVKKTVAKKDESKKVGGTVTLP